jgi:ketosteroid isomerase-like protein
MSSENVEIVRRAYEAFNSNDPEAAIALLDPEVEWTLPAHFPDAETWRGRERVVEGLTTMAASWESLNLDVQELIDAGDRVVALVHIQGRAAVTGLDLAGRGVDGHVWTLRGGRVTAVRMYGGTDEALRAVGLG